MDGSGQACVFIDAWMINEWYINAWMIRSMNGKWINRENTSCNIKNGENIFTTCEI